jgi:hypothetical protein
MREWTTMIDGPFGTDSVQRSVGRSPRRCATSPIERIGAAHPSQKATVPVPVS